MLPSATVFVIVDFSNKFRSFNYYELMTDTGKFKEVLGKGGSNAPTKTPKYHEKHTCRQQHQSLLFQEIPKQDKLQP